MMDPATTLAAAVIGGLTISAGLDILARTTIPSPTLRPPKAKKALKSAHPPSNWEAKCHPLEVQVSESIHKYFLDGWVFRSEKVAEKFPAQGLATWHCYAFPESKDDRIEAGARLSVILFLVDDELEHMSLKEGATLIDRIISIVKGDIKPDASVPAEWMMKEVWDNLASIDQVLTDEMKEPAFVFWRSQVADERLKPKTLKTYLRYREDDIASEYANPSLPIPPSPVTPANPPSLLCAIQRFSNAQHLPTSMTPLLAAVHKNYSNCITVVNDICSYAKEARVAATSAQQGSALCSAVQVLADETCLPADCAKRILWTMCREWERNHERMARDLSMVAGCDGVLKEYLDGLKLQISGTEAWSLSSMRYNDLSVI